MTPFEKLTGIEDIAAFLKPDITLESLRAEAARHSDNDAAARLSQARQQLFLSIHKRSRSVA